jgi:hypothetical protein
MLIRIQSGQWIRIRIRNPDGLYGGLNSDKFFFSYNFFALFGSGLDKMNADPQPCPQQNVMDPEHCPVEMFSDRVYR